MVEVNFPLVQFSPPCQVQFQHLSMATLMHLFYAVFMYKHLCMVTFLHSQKVPRKKCQNRLTHVCVTMVNRLGDSDESPKNRKSVLNG